MIEEINASLNDLADDMSALTEDTSDADGEKKHFDLEDEGILQVKKRISILQKDLHDHIGHINTLANSMITALASDYRCVYYVNLDENDGVCYRGDPNDHVQSKEGVHFPYLERFTWYGENAVTENYREAFLNFIQPENIRKALETQELIACRYLVRREGMEYYEMARMAGVRRLEDRDDHIVHAVGLGFTIIDHEMRETMEKNEALAEALAMAEESNIAKTSFLSNMSHEIRTPMNAIIGLNNLALHDETLNEKTRGYLEKIDGSARHLLGLINDILDMSRIESGRIVLNKEEFSFSGMLEQINTMVMSQCTEKGLTYECRILTPVSDSYIGDDTKLREVLINILSNAIKFTEAPGTVTMTAERTAVFEDQSTLKFCVKDTGIGMDKDYIPKIFEPFSQEDGSRKSKFGSTGLGMAITRSIVEMMNGTISVESEKGVGSEFTVVITLKNCETTDHREHSVDPNRIRVLVVDDEEIAAEHARMVLADSGIRADICLHPGDSLAMMETQNAKQEPYNLILMDRNMPEMDGLEAAAAIRALDRPDAKNIPIIALTANAFDEDVQRSLQVGMNAHLTKPAEPDHLYQTLKELIYEAEEGRNS